MSAVPNTIHIRIRTRLIAFLAAINLIPSFTLARGFWSITQSITDAGQALSAVQVLIVSHATIFTLVGIWVAFLVSSNLTRPINDMTSVLEQVKNRQHRLPPSRGEQKIRDEHHHQRRDSPAAFRSVSVA